LKIKPRESVVSPTHYTNGDIECIDAIKSAIGDDHFVPFCKGQALKYIWRAGLKGDFEEDIQKAMFYLSACLNADWRGNDEPDKVGS